MWGKNRLTVNDLLVYSQINWLLGIGITEFKGHEPCRVDLLITLVFFNGAYLYLWHQTLMHLSHIILYREPTCYTMPVYIAYSVSETWRYRGVCGCMFFLPAIGYSLLWYTVYHLSSVSLQLLWRELLSRLTCGTGSWWLQPLLLQRSIAVCVSGHLSFVIDPHSNEISCYIDAHCTSSADI